MIKKIGRSLIFLHAKTRVFGGVESGSSCGDIRLSAHSRETLSVHRGLADQIRRSAVSIPANIAEGYGLGTEAQMGRMLRIALGSAYELKSHLQIAVELDLVRKKEAMVTLARIDRVIGLLIGFLKSLKKTLPL